jgi:thiol-disulfide isomerase/thioredoxin
MNFFYEIKNASYRNCHLIIFGLIIIILLIFLFVINSNNNINNAEHRNESFDDISNNKLVLYYTSWCGWSQKFLPIWNDFKQKYPEIITETIECSDNQKCTNIKGYPTIIYYINGSPLLYTGNRTVDDLYQFVQKNSNKDDTFNEPTKEVNTNKKIVLYHADWCGHCKNFLPVWKQFVNQHPEINTEDIECSNNKTKCANIEGYPTVILFNGDQQIQFNGERTIDALYNFVNNN